MPRDLEEAESYECTQCQTTDRPQGQEEGKLMSIDPTAGRRKRAYKMHNNYIGILKLVTSTYICVYRS